ncbi:MAG: ankyrin repeat domain-containing protein [Cyclobacteriaceae bacterium]
MKTLKINSKKVAIAIAMFTTLLTSASCQNKKENAQEQTSKSSVKPPQVDIHTAVVTGNLEAVRQHIAAGSDINVKDPFGGSSPLISATVFGKTDIAKTLIDAGAKLNVQNNDGSTALHTAAFFCRPEIVKMLLAKGADKTIKNNYKSTAYESVLAPFKDVKSVYDMLGNALGPMGLKLDYAYIEKTRPEIAAMLK